MVSQSQRKTNPQAKQNIKKFKKSEKSEKTRREKKKDLEKKIRVIKKQHSSLRDKYNSSKRKKEQLKLQPRKAGSQLGHLL